MRHPVSHSPYLSWDTEGRKWGAGIASNLRHGRLNERGGGLRGGPFHDEKDSTCVLRRPAIPGPIAAGSLGPFQSRHRLRVTDLHRVQRPLTLSLSREGEREQWKGPAGSLGRFPGRGIQVRICRHQRRGRGRSWRIDSSNNPFSTLLTSLRRCTGSSMTRASRPRRSTSSGAARTSSPPSPSPGSGGPRRTSRRSTSTRAGGCRPVSSSTISRRW